MIIVALPLAFLLLGATCMSVEKTAKGYKAKYSTFWTNKEYKDVTISKDSKGDVTVSFGSVNSQKMQSQLLDLLEEAVKRKLATPGP